MFVADTSDYAYSVDSSNIADSSAVAFLSGSAAQVPTWRLNGNSDAQALGTTDKDSLVFATDGVRRMTLRPDGIGIGIGPATPGWYGTIEDGVYFDYSVALGSDLNFEDTALYLYAMADRGALLIGKGVDSIWKSSSVGRSAFSMGENNIVEGNYAFAIGKNNSIDADGRFSFVVGEGHQTSGYYALMSGRNCFVEFNRSVAMGDSCSAPSGYACIAMGSNAVAHGNIEPCVAIGRNIYNNGRYSTVFGNTVHIAARQGSFVYSDYSTPDTLTFMPASGYYNFFQIRAAGGSYFYSDSGATTGVYLAAGSGSWSTTSDSASKIVLGEPRIIERLNSLPVYSWSYKSESDVLHVGPMAQDLFQQYALGEDQKRISMVDADGLVLQGIKEIKSEVDQLDWMKGRMESIVNDFEEMEERLLKLKNQSSK